MSTAFSRYLYDKARPVKRIVAACVAAACDRDAGNNRAKMASTIEAVVQEHPGVEVRPYRATHTIPGS